jgi:hypothetical protein
MRAVRSIPRLAGAVAVGALLLAICAAPAGGAPWNWRRDALPDDVGRVMALPAAWVRALAEVRANGYGSTLMQLGALVDPGASLERAEPPPGPYHCRVVRLGSHNDSTHPLVADPWFMCRVDYTPRGDLTFLRISGTTHTAGHLYPETDDRLIYLGAEDEAATPVYGRRPERDQVGVMERIGPRRWRLALPFPRRDPILELVDIVR